MEIVKLCACGCGTPTPIATQTRRAKGHVKGEPVRFVAGHEARTRKVRDGWYKQMVHQGQMRLEHSVIAERALGKPMPVKAEVHHVDGNKHNNAPSNLVICQDHAYHLLLHARTRIVRAGGNPNTERLCGSCRRLLPIEAFHPSRHLSLGTCNMCRACKRQYKATWTQRQRDKRAAVYDRHVATD